MLLKLLEAMLSQKKDVRLFQMKTYGKVSYDVFETIGNYALTEKRRAVILNEDLWQSEL